MRKKVTVLIVTLVTVLCMTMLIPSLVMAQKKPGAGMYFRLVTHGGNDPFWAVVQKGMMDAADELGCKADIDLCGSDLALQAKRFQEAVAMKPDGIALVINDDTMWDKPVADAIAKGVNVIGMNNDDTKGPAGNARLCYIGQNEKRAGYMIGLALINAAKAKGWDLGKIKFAAGVEVAGANYGVVRSSGIMQAMEEMGVKSDLDIVDCTLEMTTAEQRLTSYIIGHSDVKCMFGLGGITTDRLTSAMKNAGKKPGDILGGGFDAAPGTLSGLEGGYMIASIDQQQYLQGYFSVYVLYLMKRYGFAPQVDTGGFLITKDNIDLIKKLSPLHIR
jgi:simple sugar transport system substrate-binding protein